MRLPEECLELVFTFMSSSEVCRVASVCQEWEAMASRDAVWSNRNLPGGTYAVDHIKSYSEIYYSGVARCPQDVFRCALQGFYVNNGEAKVDVNRGDGALAYYISLGAETKAKVVSVENELCSSEVEYADDSPFPFMFHLTDFIPGGWGNNRFLFFGAGPLTCFLPPGTYSLGWRISRDEYWECEKAFGRRVVEGLGGFHLRNRFWCGSQQVSRTLYIDSNNVPQIPNWLEAELGEFVVEPSNKNLEGPDVTDLPHWAEIGSEHRFDSGRLRRVELYAEIRSLTTLQSWGGGLYIDALVLKRLPN